MHALLERLDFAHPVLAGDDEVAALAGAFARSPLCARLAAARELRREAAFAFVLGDGIVRGFLDVAGIEPDGTMLIVDYKSDRVGEDEDLAEHVERDYAIQRQVYALAALSAGAPAVEVAHCFLRRPETVVSRSLRGERARAPGGGARGARRAAPRGALRRLAGARARALRRLPGPGATVLLRRGDDLARAARTPLRTRARLLAFAHPQVGPVRPLRARTRRPRETSKMSLTSQFQQADGLYDPRYEHDACGVGVVARLDNRPTNEVVRLAIDALANLEHRGAAGADPETGDGAGILIQMPDALLREVVEFELPPAGCYGVAMCFLPKADEPRAELEAMLERIVVAEGQHVLGWRDVPTDDRHVGPTARASQPVDPPALHRRRARAGGRSGRLRAQALRDPPARREGVRRAHVHREPAPRGRWSTRGC